MNPHIAAAAFALGILGLFYLDREAKARTSWSIWIAMVWLAIGGSRVVSAWLNAEGGASASEAYLEGNPLDRNIQSVLMALCLCFLVQRRRFVAKVLRENIPILIFFGYCGVSIIWSEFPAAAIRRWFKALGDVLVVLVVLSDPDRSAVLKLPARVGFILIPTSILLMRYFPEMARAFDPITGEPTYTGVATSKNSLGLVCLMFGLGSLGRLYQAWESPGGWSRSGRLMAHSVVFAAAMWLLLGCDSKTSMACFFIAAGLGYVAGIPWVAKRPALVNAMSAFVIFGTFAVLFLQVGSGLLQSMGRNSSLTGRTEIWSRVLGMVTSPVLGTGYESFWLGDRLEKMLSLYRGINQAHNGYIEIYLNLGWAGVCLLLMVIWTGYFKIVNSLRIDPELGRFRLSYFLVGVISNFTEAGFKMMSPVWVMFLIAIMAVPRAPVSKVASREPLSAKVFLPKWEPRGNRPIGQLRRSVV